MTLLHNLIESCKEKKIDNISLEVMESNKAAKNLYFKNNFIIYGKREKIAQQFLLDKMKDCKTNEEFFSSMNQ